MSERVVETLRWLCETPSPIGEEGPLCDAVLARVQKSALAAPPRRTLNSVVVPVTRGRGGPSVVLAGHLDVVRTVHDGPVRIEGDRLYGAGAADMKAGLAVMLELLECGAIAEAPLDVTLVFYSREEGPYAENELGPVLDAEPELRTADFAICLEPSDNVLQLGCNGSLHATVTFQGRTAHSSRPWQGDNAIHKAASLLADLAALTPVELRDGDLVYRSVTTATTAHGGRGRNIVPDLFELNLNHRFTPGTSIEQAKATVTALVAGRADVTFIDESPSAPTFASHPMTRRLVDAGVRGIEPKQAWTDVARLAAAGVAAVNFGPGVNAQAHQRNEHTSIALLLEGVDIMKRFLKGERVGGR